MKRCGLDLVQEFAEYAQAQDLSEVVPGRTPLELPYAIDGDRVGGASVKLLFNKVHFQDMWCLMSVLISPNLTSTKPSSWAGVARGGSGGRHSSPVCNA